MPYLCQLSDPRFERRKGKYSDYLLPSMVNISAGMYPIGRDHSQYSNELVELNSFDIGKFAVTNAEYALFIAAKGYKDERWWDDALLRDSDLSTTILDGQKGWWLNFRDYLMNFTIDELASEKKSLPMQTLHVRSMSLQQFLKWLNEIYSTNNKVLHPAYWNVNNFNNPAQPVVGVCWYEAKAYTLWLSAQTDYDFHLPEQLHIKAAVSGKEGRPYSYGRRFDPTKSNTFESHIRRITPIGAFDNATPEGVYDLNGNTYTWKNTQLLPEQLWNKESVLIANDISGQSWKHRHSGKISYNFDHNPFFRGNARGLRLIRKIL